MDKLREAIEVLKSIPRRPLGNEGQTNLYGIEYEALQTLLNLAQSVIDQKEPKEKEHTKNCNDPEVCNDLCGASNYNQALADFRLWNAKCLGELDIEKICEQVHKAYCKYHLENKGVEYWTKGDYSLLTEEGKEYDRRTVRAVLESIRNLFGDK